MLDWLQLALGEPPVLACTHLGFDECGFVLSPPGATVVELTKCPRAESDLQTKCLWRVEIPEKGSSLCLEFLLSDVYFWTDYKH